jgi:hypothetical protein
MKSEYLRKQFQEADQAFNDTPVITLDMCPADLFPQLVKFFYMDTCDLLSPGFIWEAETEQEEEQDFVPTISKKLGKKSAFEVYQKMKDVEEKPVVKNVLQRLFEVARKLGMGGLIHRFATISIYMLYSAELSHIFPD